MNNLTDLINHLQETNLAAWATELPELIKQKLSQEHGDLIKWQTAIAELPEITAEHIELAKDFAIKAPLSEAQQTQLEKCLRQLMPWRKGPFHLFGIDIDTEWRSNWKWERVKKHLDLQGKNILDVGCGNGYYQWRMLGAGAKTVLGVDPNLLFLHQFLAIKKYLPNTPVWTLPITLDDLPAKSESFDMVFSMGVLYHRRSPIDHLQELKDCLVTGGELVLETLIVDGDEQQVLVPEDRYAQMRNVWFLPSVAALELWLKRLGFKNIRCVDVNQTSVDEQHTTSWMNFQSLPYFLDANDNNLTIEGLPAPKRAIILATK